MPLQQWSERNESLNALCAAIQQGTHGLIRILSLDLTDGGCVVVCATSRSYYGVQLAIHTTKQFGDKHRLFGATQLLLNVDGTLVQLVVTHPSGNEARESASTQDANRRPQLTFAAAE